VLLSLDWTLAVQLINFLVFLVVLNVIFLKPVGAAIAKRRAYIDGVAHDITQFEADLKSLSMQAEERRAVARRDAAVVLAQARSQAQEEAASIAAGFAARAAQLVAEADATVRREAAQARENERAIVESLADALLTQALGPELAV
jgi:F-type H+-transporting ATPase subunit b